MRSNDRFAVGELLRMASLAGIFSLLLAGCSLSRAPELIDSTRDESPSPTNTWELSKTLTPTMDSPFPKISETPTVTVTFPPPVSTTEIPAPAEPTPTDFQICSPLSLHPLQELREIISDPYRPPPPGKEERHHGVDFSYYRRGERLTIQGVGVQSVMPGNVAASISNSYPYGNVVIIETPYALLPEEINDLVAIPKGDSIYTLYAHMEQPPLVSLGDVVTPCQALGQVGKSGNAVEPHLHLEMRVGPPEAVFASMAFYGLQDTQDERSNYVRWRTGGKFRHFNPMLVLRDLVKALGKN